MKKNDSSAPSPWPTAQTQPPLLHRSGAVARMLQMPVATLRVWERRYGLTQPALAPGAQRLYSAHDIRRLALIKQLTTLGHAIGSLASLDMSQLQSVASTHAHTQAQTTMHRHKRLVMPLEPPVAMPVPAWRLAVIGAALYARLQRPGLLHRLERPLVLLGPFDNLAQAASAVQSAPLSAVLIHEPRLHDGWLAALHAAAPAFADVPKAVLFNFAAESVCEALAEAGTALLREPQPDTVVAQWLHSLSASRVAVPLSEATPPMPEPETTQPRRWSDAVLTDFANMSSTTTCECPRHLAELLMQLAHFEDYSADCKQRNVADVELHAYLHQVAATSRVRLEAALEQVALHEGLLLS